jgi:hypothetical protein
MAIIKIPYLRWVCTNGIISLEGLNQVIKHYFNPSRPVVTIHATGVNNIDIFVLSQNALTCFSEQTVIISVRKINGLAFTRYSVFCARTYPYTEFRLNWS